MGFEEGVGLSGLLVMPAGDGGTFWHFLSRMGTEREREKERSGQSQCKLCLSEESSLPLQNWVCNRKTQARHPTSSAVNSLRCCKVSPLMPLIPSFCLVLCRPLLRLPSILPNISIFPIHPLHALCDQSMSFCLQIVASREQLGFIWSRTD